MAKNGKMQNLNTDSKVEIIRILLNLLNKHSLKAAEWTEIKSRLISESGQAKDLFLAFSIAPRFVGKEALEINDEFKSAIFNCGFFISLTGWSTDELVRVILLLSYPSHDEEKYYNTINELFKTGEVRELVTLYKALSFLPNKEKFVLQGTEGVRSNMGVVFDAIALNNPYPQKVFNLTAWNQMVLKAIFTGRPLKQIVGLEERRNAELARMAVDFAHERWAAGREVNAELWRLLGPYVEEKHSEDLKRLFEKGTEKEKAAAALLCFENQGNPICDQFLSPHPELVNKCKNGEISWMDI